MVSTPILSKVVVASQVVVAIHILFYAVVSIPVDREWSMPPREKTQRNTCKYLICQVVVVLNRGIDFRVGTEQHVSTKTTRIVTFL